MPCYFLLSFFLSFTDKKPNEKTFFLKKEIYIYFFYRIARERGGGAEIYIYENLQRSMLSYERLMRVAILDEKKIIAW